VPAALRVVSWNVNGLRACTRKGFVDWLRRSGAAIVALQEVRALEHEWPAETLVLPGWHRATSSARRRGYSGVALLSHQPFEEVQTSLGEERFDVEGRVQVARVRRLAIVNAYFPKGSGRDRDNSRVPYKLDFSRALLRVCEDLRAEGLRVLVVGDFNTAHQAIDLARPRQNTQTSGFLPEERAELDRWVAAGWVDTFRQFEPGPGHYTWWSQRFGVREKNIGWRIDYVLCSPSLRPWLRAAFIQPEVRGSDHCPVGVDLDPTVTD
jgi:exodeoxyribonuclease-3